jgi:hypothetical protein
MALGKRKDQYLPLLKYDARTGVFALADRVQVDGEWQTKQTDVTDNFRATLDLVNLQVGWISFPKDGPPEVKLVPVGQDIGECPGKGWKQGLRLVVKMAPALGGDVRELMSTALALWTAVDILHDEFCTAAADHVRELPVVVVSETRENKTTSGTTHTPVFEIAEWVPRPSDLAGALPRSARVGRQGDLDFDRPLQSDI